MSTNVTSKVEPHALGDSEVDTVIGGTLSALPLGTEELFWDPLWWEVGRTGHLPTVRIPR